MAPPVSLANPQQVALGSVLAIAMTGAIIPAAAVSVLADFLVHDLGLSNTQIGVLITAFSIASAFWSAPAGRLSDWAGGRRMLVACFSVAAVGMVVLAVAPTFAWMVVAIVIGGFANGVGSPATNKLVSSVLPAGSRGTVVGVKQSGVQFAYLVAGLMLPTVALASNWRWAFAATVLVPASGLLLLRIAVPATSISGGMDHEVDGRPSRPDTRWLTAYAFLMGAAIGPVTAYLPLFAIQSVGLGVQAAGVLIGVLSFVAIVARVLLGRHGENVDHYARLLATLALVSFIGVCFVWVSEATGSRWVLWSAAILLGASLFAWTSIGMLAVIRDAGHAKTGRASGWMMAAFLGGSGASPTLFGFSVDATGSYRMGWAGVLVLLSLACASAFAWLRSSGSHRSVNAAS